VLETLITSRDGSVTLSKRLREALDRVITEVQELCQSDKILVHPLFIKPPLPETDPMCVSQNEGKLVELQDLHVSLSHPLPLRRDQVSLLHDHLSRTPSTRSGTGGPLRIGLVNTVVAYRNGALSKESLVSRGTDAARTRRDVNSGDRSITASADTEDGYLGGLGTTGVGRGGRAFLALRVGAGHDAVSAE
jgi:hypothetical protein